MRPIMVNAVKTLVYGNVEAMRNGEEPQYNLSHLTRAHFLALPVEGRSLTRVQGRGALPSLREGCRVRYR